MKKVTDPIKITVFASGTGSNFRAIVQSIESGKLNAKLVGLISNNPGAGAVEFAQVKGIPYQIINQHRYPDDDVRDNRIIEILKEWSTELIVLAGYMKKIGLKIIAAYPNRIVNIHPALLPSFGGKGMYGIHVHEAVIHSGVKYSGLTVHIVNNEYDAGPIVLQRIVSVYDDDTPETLQQRILVEEHKAYSEAISYFADDGITVAGQRTFIKRENAED